MVKVGNGGYVDVKGRGTVAIKTNSGIKLISDVLFVPDISQNLLSVGQMLEKQYSLQFKDNQCIIFDPYGEKLLCLKMKSKSFAINWENAAEYAYAGVTQSVSDLWHKRFGHYNQRSLVELKKLELVEDMPNVSNEAQICEICQQGKQSRLPFKNNQAWRATEKLQLIHTDVCGPMKTTSLSGNKYFILFIDDYTRMCWVYFIKLKNEVFSVFKQFKALVENQSNLSIKILRSDNGTEYTSSQFVEFCSTAGIKRQLTTPYTPQQNGVSERKNQTVKQMARCLLFEKKMPSNFWAEAVNTFAYLLNRLPTKSLKNKTPHEAWYGVKPFVNHLKIFGSICYYHVPKPKRSKLDGRAQKGILIGYGTSTKGYRIFCLQINKVVLTRNVKVDEMTTWDWKNKKDAQSDADFDNHEDFQTSKFVDDFPVRGTRSLEDIYQRCSLSITEPKSYVEAKDSEAWRRAMQEELKMINKNET
ncbi:hypothetical protein VitviT2T_028060 [Vitis vinifera]|uniref:Integrase catalytic domain-containing protein n=1 Tax=Vitis vinifera TaxID=29760 RepID=A0ABY9DTW9_VITVI|nr:hypothetical protein VitviT2T_028060 [Vitis vinifera]